MVSGKQPKIQMRTASVEFTNGHSLHLNFDEAEDALHIFRQWWLSGLIFSETEEALRNMIRRQWNFNITAEGPWETLDAHGHPLMAGEYRDGR